MTFAAVKKTIRKNSLFFGSNWMANTSAIYNNILYYVSSHLYAGIT